VSDDADELLGTGEGTPAALTPAAPTPTAPPDVAAEGLRGADLVRAALAQARARAAEKGIVPGGRRRPVLKRERRSGAGKDARDPVLFGDAVRRLVEERGWQETTTNASVLERWDAIVGAEVAEHCRPTSLVDGELVLVAESSAWATQVRLLAGQLLKTIREAVGPDVVTKVVVRGPVQPNWRKGPRRVTGRGPRDTYG
jgi:predicted nucleic acid-binding Zn ribbon protein